MESIYPQVNVNFFCGSVSLGYYIGQDKHYQINENEAVFNRKIFEMYVYGKTSVEIEKFLLDNKIYNNGKTIGHGTVKLFYIINVIWVIIIKDGIPLIISDELYVTWQAFLWRTRKITTSAS